MGHWYDRYMKGSRSTRTASSFWQDEFDVDYESPTYKSALNESQIDTLKKYRLSSARKAISNFVTIATGQQIPVRFSTGTESYTDGKQVTLSGDIDDSTKFDIGVGLALHEGSHILLSDFKFLQNLYSHMQQNEQSLLALAESKGIDSVSESVNNVKTLLNIVEDRRIDNYIYTNAPGYREYYLKMYENYFGSKLITEALESDEWKEESVEHYINRIINITNPATSLSALKGMRKIWHTLNIANIGRLRNTMDAYAVAVQLYRIILENIPTPLGKKQDQQNQQQKDEQGDGESSQQSAGQSPDADNDSDEQSRGGSSMSAEGGEGEEQSSSESGDAGDSDGEGEEKESLSEAKRKKLKKIIEEQKKFVEGNLKKKKISKQLSDQINSVEDSGAEIVNVGKDGGLHDQRRNPVKGCEVVLIKSVTMDMVRKDFHLGSRGFDYKTKTHTLRTVLSDEEFNTAERMGTMLGKKLQVRNEARTTVFNRQRNGSIDKRLIHSLGFEAESVFTQIHVDKYKKANVHLSIDASSSMAGSKWNKTMINAIALAKAVSMIQNLSMQISFRYTDETMPIVAVCWDSRKESYTKVKQMFRYLHAHGTTPEGLAFEAIRKLIVNPSNDMDSYFVNISDGEPSFSNKGVYYCGESAFEHTRKQIDGYRKDGIVILSYFVSDSYSPISSAYSSRNYGFDKMYGKDARYININSVVEVTNTLNKMFMVK